MTSTTLVLFLTSSLLLAITPGPTMLLTLSNGAAGGMRLAIFGMLGSNLGSGLLIAAAALGLGSVLAASETLFNALRWLGVIYLCWMGVQLWRSQPRALADAMKDNNGALATPGLLTPRAAFLRSLSVALSNPKTLLFFGAFLPQFVDAAAPQGPQYALLGLIFLGLDTLVMVAYAGAGSQFMRLLTQRGLKLLNRACATGMWLLAAALAAYRRT